jgi:hypothetical protein
MSLDEQGKIAAHLAKLRHGHEMPPDFAAAPILDIWQFAFDADDDLMLEGEVSADARFVTGSTITTSPLRAIDGSGQGRWARTLNTTYRLGWPKLTVDPVWTVLLSKSFDEAVQVVAGLTGEHLIPPTASNAYLNLRQRWDGTPPAWASRRELAYVIAELLIGVGRHSVGRAWRALGMVPGVAGATRLLSSVGETPPGDDARRVLKFWNQIQAEALHVTQWRDHIAEQWKRTIIDLELNALDRSALKRLVPDADAETADGRPKQVTAVPDDDDAPEQQERGVVAIPEVGGLHTAYQTKTILESVKRVVGKRLYLAPMPDVAAVRATLHAEFPHAIEVVDTLLSGLRGDHPYSRPTMLVGPAGNGKSRLAERFGMLVWGVAETIPGGSMTDGSFGGAARHWSTGEPAVPVSRLLIRQARADGLVVLDEIDKAGTSDHNGRFQNVLLQMIERQNAKRYFDQYLQAHVDLSYVSWLATANDTSGLSAPLKDRMRLIKMPEPGRQHMVPLARSIVAAVAAESGEDPRFYPMLEDGELAVVEGLWRGGSIRRLGEIVRALLRHREARARN